VVCDCAGVGDECDKSVVERISSRAVVYDEDVDFGYLDVVPEN